MTERPEIAARFERDTADHAMTVLHDDGLYRHLRFQRQVWRPPLAKPLRSSTYWFELITVPGSLTFRGDGESFVFARLTDMFEFFRGSAYGGPNLGYWAEKVTSAPGATERFSEEMFVRTMREHYVELIRAGDVPPGTSRALLARAEDYDLSYEVNARDFIDTFQHEGFRFHDTWDWDFQDYDWWFVWACHAIMWGIEQYDTASRAPVVVDVELPAAVA